MANFGWAYVDCDDAGSAAGPAHSLQFVTGSGTNTTGSYNLLFYSASHAEVQPAMSAHLILSGNLTVTGAISASAIHYQDVSHIDATGSTFFGDSVGDIHLRTGSLTVYGLADAGSASEYTLSASSHLGSTYVRGFGGNYRQAISASNTTGSVAYDDYVIGISSSANPLTLQLRSGSLHPAGQTLIIKNESQHASAAQTVFITTQTGGWSGDPGYLIEGDPTYSMNGTMAAISLYNDGTNWLIF